MRHCKLAFLAMLCVSFIGCRDTGADRLGDNPALIVEHIEGDVPEGVTVHKSRDPSAPPRVSRQPEVFDNQERMEEVRREYARDIDRLYQAAMERVRQGEWLFPEHEQSLDYRRRQAIRDLQQVAASERSTAAARAKAAQTLVKLGDPSGEQLLFEFLRSDAAELRQSAIEQLRDYDLRVDFSPPDRRIRLLSLLEDPNHEVMQAAVKLCAFRRIPGAEDKLIALVQSGRGGRASLLAWELAEFATTKRAVDAILPHLFAERPGEYPQWHGYRLKGLLHHPDPQIAAPVRQALYRFALGYSNLRYDQRVVSDLAQAADTDAMVLLDDIRRNAPDPVSRDYAVEALARLQPQRAVDLLLEAMSGQGARSGLMAALRAHASEADFDRIAAMLVSGQPAQSSLWHVEVVRLMLERLGDRGRSFVQERWDKFDKHAQMWALWKLQGLNLQTALEALRTAGVIHSRPEEILSRLESKNDAEKLDRSDPHLLIAALAEEGIVAGFDAESGEVPCNHHRLVELLGKASSGQFVAETPVQRWHQKSHEDWDAPYTVEFIYRGRLYRVGAENYGDWYDVEALLRLVNFALQSSGQPQRYLMLESDGQFASLVFADPGVFLPIAKKYGVPISDDATQAMRAGRASEQQLLEELR